MTPGSSVEVAVIVTASTGPTAVTVPTSIVETAVMVTDMPPATSISATIELVAAIVTASRPTRIVIAPTSSALAASIATGAIGATRTRSPATTAETASICTPATGPVAVIVPGSSVEVAVLVADIGQVCVPGGISTSTHGPAYAMRLGLPGVERVAVAVPPAAVPALHQQRLPSLHATVVWSVTAPPVAYPAPSWSSNR